MSRPEGSACFYPTPQHRVLMREQATVCEMCAPILFIYRATGGHTHTQRLAKTEEALFFIPFILLVKFL